MQATVEIRKSMLRELKTSLEASGVTREIIFKEGTLTLCNVPYYEVDVDDDGSKAVAIFKNTSDGELISGSVSVAGTADTFEIWGKDLDVGGSPTGSPKIILSGTVGDLGSGRDIEFTRTEWSDEAIVRISRLRVVLL